VSGWWAPFGAACCLPVGAILRIVGGPVHTRSDRSVRDLRSHRRTIPAAPQAPPHLDVTTVRRRRQSHGGGAALLPLERDGLIALVAADNDRRRRRVVLTTRGRAKFAQARRAWRLARDRGLGGAGARVVDAISLSIPISSLHGKDPRESAEVVDALGEVLKKLAAEVG
jgi:DNA-binding MarR family transcriptional regulator